MSNNMPTSTQWLLDAVGDTGRNSINSVYVIVCPKTGSKGTGFLIESGHIITNEHVIKGCNHSEVFALNSNGAQITFKNLVSGNQSDLAALTPLSLLAGGLKIVDEKNEVGIKVNTWGHPLSYNGPAPILSVGYLAGFRENINQVGARKIKHLIINGAFNPGNSGGPLFKSGSDEIIGVVVAKHAPFPQSVMSGLKALQENSSGLQFSGKDSNGNPINVSESQIVGMFLDHLRSLVQVNIGEVIAASELLTFLSSNNIK